MEAIKEVWNKHKDMILYLFFGGCTTLVNIICYSVLYHMLMVSNMNSTIIAWVLSVIFAYVTNRRFVFESKASGWKARFYEMGTFFGCRIATGVMDTIIMVFAVDHMHWNSLLWKVISNILVIVINYIASKFVIFRRQ